MLKTKEFYEILEMFEKDFQISPEKEPKELWPNGAFYKNGETNKLFNAYFKGYSFGKSAN